MKIHPKTRKQLGFIGTIKFIVSVNILLIRSDYHVICSGDWSIYSPIYNQDIYYNPYTNTYGLHSTYD